MGWRQSSSHALFVFFIYPAFLSALWKKKKITHCTENCFVLVAACLVDFTLHAFYINSTTKDQHCDTWVTHGSWWWGLFYGPGRCYCDLVITCFNCRFTALCGKLVCVCISRRGSYFCGSDCLKQNALTTVALLMYTSGHVTVPVDCWVCRICFFSLSLTPQWSVVKKKKAHLQVHAVRA